jgi:hypothetical protein
MHKLLFIAALLFIVTPTRANDIYLAQNAAGGATGADCADAVPYTLFNSSSNWGSGGTQIGPGTTVHLCGTITAPPGASGFLGFHASGTNGNPITLKFETGAILQAPYWGGGGAITTNANSWVTIDGGTNGILQATQNGTSLANQQDGEGVVAEGGSDVTIQNLTISNLYVHTNSLADESGQNSIGIDIWSGSNLSVIGCTLHDMKWAIRFSYATGHTFSTMTASNNTIYNIDHGIFLTDSSASGSAIMSGFTLSGNTVHDFANWDDNNDDNHHDAFHLNTNSSSTLFTNFYLYNNYVYGDPGIRGNAGFFSFPASVGSESGLYIFNNVFVNTSSGHCWANGSVALAGVSTSNVVNNTFVSQATSCKDIGFVYELGSTGVTFENNIGQNTENAAVYAPTPGAVVALDHNNYYQSSSWNFSGTWYNSLAGWESGTGFDRNSGVLNPNLDANFKPGSGSAVIGKGANLSSLCSAVPQLCGDKNGTVRPSSGAWDIGALQSGGSAADNPPNAPSDLSVVVN